MVRLVANSQGADVHAPNLLANHRIPHCRRVVGSLDPMPWTLGEPVVGSEPGVGELAKGGDLTRARVDEEPAHPHGG